MSYNGWSNYETWRVNLELFDGMNLSDDIGFSGDIDDRDEAISELAETLKEMAHETVAMDAKGWALDLAFSFLSKVNFRELAEHMIDDYIAENDV